MAQSTGSHLGISVENIALSQHPTDITSVLEIRSLFPSTNPSLCAKYTPAGAVGASEACKPPLDEALADVAANKPDVDASALRSSSWAFKVKKKCSP